MEIREALTIVRKLADGVHPETGEVLQTDCLYNHPQSVRALHRAVEALEFQDERERTKRFLPSNAGKAWSNQEDAQICEELRRGMTFEQIAQSHNRTNGSIISRLVRLGKISAGPQALPQWQAAHLSQSQFQAACRKRTVSISLVWETILPRSRIRRP